MSVYLYKMTNRHENDSEKSTCNWHNALYIFQNRRAQIMDKDVLWMWILCVGIFFHITINFIVGGYFLNVLFWIVIWMTRASGILGLYNNQLLLWNQEVQKIC